MPSVISFHKNIQTLSIFDLNLRNMARILVIDDEKSIRNTLREIFEYEKFQVDDAQDGIEGIARAKEQNYDVILCDIKMPKMDGIEVLHQLLGITDAPVVMISGHGTIETAVDAIRAGAYDYIAKPLDLNRLLVTIRNAIDKVALVNETRQLRKRISGNYDIIGESESIRLVKEMISKVAPTDARVLITGENGTGKELVARWLHALSNRPNAPFVEVNCAAIPPELIESNLFGHEKGSFTSAIKQHKGDFEQASGGTLFLDEIGDMSLSAQSKVLRALQENKIMRVGGEKEIPVDVRVIAATNKNLRQEIAAKNFREDLYHRLSVIIIDVPALEKRMDDIPLLVDHFIEEFVRSMGKPRPLVTPEAIEALQKIKWSGNIRELKNVVERLVILCEGRITEDDIARYAGS
jgi:two-component system, NtrC family, nitrogen regulation response regulator NtrX